MFTGTSSICLFFFFFFFFFLLGILTPTLISFHISGLIWRTNAPLPFPVVLVILYHFIQFSSHASRGPPKCRNVTFVMAIFMVCRIHLAIMWLIYKFFRRLRHLTAENFPKVWACHANFGRSPKPKFRQARHASRALPNWMKWYSICSYWSMFVL